VGPTAASLEVRPLRLRVYIIATVHEPLWRVTKCGQLSTWASEESLSRLQPFLDGGARVISGYRATFLQRFLDRVHNRALYRHPLTRIAARRYAHGALALRPLTNARVVGPAIEQAVPYFQTSHPSLISEMDASVLAALGDFVQSDTDLALIVNSSTYVNIDGFLREIFDLFDGSDAGEPLIAGPSGSLGDVQFLTGWFRVFNSRAAQMLYENRSSIRRDSLEDVELSRLAKRLGVQLVSLETTWVTADTDLSSWCEDLTAVPAAIRCKADGDRQDDILTMHRVHQLLMRMGS